jgi:threonylcarbamoyladenosine tRNA methylthiotransferase MtaB
MSLEYLQNKIFVYIDIYKIMYMFFYGRIKNMSHNDNLTDSFTDDTKDKSSGEESSKPSHSIKTFGCRLNIYESQLMNSFLKKYQLEDKVLLVNSCAVTNKTESDIIRFVKKQKKDFPEKKIIFTGCGSQTNPQKYANISQIDFIIGNKEKTQEEIFKKLADSINLGQKFDSSLINSQKQTQEEVKKLHQDVLYKKQIGQTSLIQEGRVIISDIMDLKETAVHMVDNFEGTTRAFVQIQNGCNHRCTFCIIPFARGNSRSAPLGSIIEQINKLVESGIKEVVLTGVDITDYGKDLPVKITLSQTIKRILKLCPNLVRLRLSSIDVAEIDEEIFEILQTQERFMPYFHISLQSGDDLVLKQMARRHTRNDVIKFCNKVRSINSLAMFGADIISSFPTESEEAFNNSLSIIKEAGIAFGHIFTFSPKNGTPAAKIKQINGKIAKNRTKILIEASKNECIRQYQSMIGLDLEVLAEKDNFARARNFSLVKIIDKNIQTNAIINCKIIDANEKYLIAKLN